MKGIDQEKLRDRALQLMQRANVTVRCAHAGCTKSAISSARGLERIGWWAFRWTDGFGFCPEHRPCPREVAK
jgi:hypothetical protein